jgi:hypothetical protein
MTTRRPIGENLISCRNILLGGRTTPHVLPCLEEVLSALDSITVSSTRKVVERCTAEAVDQVKDANFVSAGLILHLIHNLPLDDASEQRWDVDYFLSMELSTFLERFEEIKSARTIALFVCKQLACRYLPDGS